MIPGKGTKTGYDIQVSGMVFLLIGALLLVAALNTGNNLFYIVLGGVVSFLLMSLILAVWTLRNLRLRRDAPAIVQRGEPFLIEVRIENRKQVMPAIGLCVEPVGAADEREPLAFLMKVPARRAAMLNVSYVLHRRGLHRIPPFRVSTGFPFGLIERSCRFEDELEVLVYPRVRPMRAAVVEQLPGPVATARSASADGEEYFSIREYIPGDEIRRIAWRLSARRGTWMVREMSHQHSRFVVFALDTRPAPGIENFPERFEEAIEVTASLAVTLLKRQYNVGIITPDTSIEGGEGSSQERKILELLARLQPSSPVSDFDTKLRKLESHEARLICISPDEAQWGKRLTAGGLWVLDPRETTHA